MDENEKKIITLISNSLNKLANLLFSYLNFFSPNSEKIKNSFHFNRYKYLNQNESNKDELNEEIINSKVKNYYEEFKNQISAFKEYLDDFNKYYAKNSLSSFNYTNMNELYNLFQELKNLRTKNELFKDKLQKNEIIFIMFKHIVSIGEYAIVEDSLKSEIKNSYYLRNKIKQDRNSFQNNPVGIKVTINNYIKNVLNSNIEFNFDPKGLIVIKYSPFLISISLPLKDNLFLLKKKAVININFIHHKKENYDLILIDKIRTLFENRILSILNLVYDEKKVNYQNLISIYQQNLTDFIIHFLNYLYSYNEMMSKKCALCNKISKYSYLENSFFPPYYKLYKTYKSNSDIKEIESLFYHEDCFRKISNSSL